MQCSWLVLTKKTHNSALTGRKGRNQEILLRYGGQNPNIYFHYLCSFFGSHHKFEHVLAREVTSLMVTLRRAMQMKSMTLRAGRRWETWLAKNYRKKKQRNQQNAVKRSERRRSAAGTSGFLHRNVNDILQVEGLFWCHVLIAAIRESYFPSCNIALQPDGGAADPQNIGRDHTRVCMQKDLFKSDHNIWGTWYLDSCSKTAITSPITVNSRKRLGCSKSVLF